MVLFLYEHRASVGERIPFIQPVESRGRGCRLPELPLVGNDRCIPKSSNLILRLATPTINFSVVFSCYHFSSSRLWKKHFENNRLLNKEIFNTSSVLVLYIKICVCVCECVKDLRLFIWYHKRIICWSWFVKIQVYSFLGKFMDFRYSLNQQK